MNPVDLSFLILVRCNTLRMAALAPQLHQAPACENGANPVSPLSWILFLISHLSGAVDALLNARDGTLARIFLSNAAGCAAILATAGARELANARRRLRISSHPAHHDRPASGLRASRAA